MVCKIESELLLFCHPPPSANSNSPSSPPGFQVALCAPENCGSSNPPPPVAMSNLKFKPLEMGFNTLNSSDGLPKKTPVQGTLLLSGGQPALECRQLWKWPVETGRLHSPGVLPGGPRLPNRRRGSSPTCVSKQLPTCFRWQEAPAEMPHLRR